MSTRRKMILGFAVFCLVWLAAAWGSAVIRAAPEAYSLNWWTVDTGGGTSQGGPYVLQGTIGQPDTGCIAGGSFALEGGFWSCTQEIRVFLPLVNH